MINWTWMDQIGDGVLDPDFPQSYGRAARERSRMTGTRTRKYPTRGFASMDRTKQKEIARAGGKAAQARGTAHRWTTEAARAAGKKGGDANRAKRDARVRRAHAIAARDAYDRAMQASIVPLETLTTAELVDIDTMLDVLDAHDKPETPR